MELSEDHKMIREMVRKFALAEVKPRAKEIDRTGEFPWDTIEKMRELNLLGMPFPEEWGGGGSDTLGYTIGVEEISRVCAATGITMAAHTSLGVYPIFEHGNDEQKKKYLKDIASGKKLAAFGLTEPNAGSDAGGTQTTAVKDGDHYVINGTKIFITSGSLAETFVITAVTNKDAGVRGITAFIIEKGTPGFKPGKKEDKMGIRGSDTSELIFEDCRVPAESMLGKEGEGFAIFLHTLDGGRISIGAMGLGIAQAALDASIEYAKERKQFGRSIGKFGAVQNMLADMATEIEAARLLVYDASMAKDRGERIIKLAAMAKLYATEVAVRATRTAVQIHGGYGYMKEYEVERFFRDAKVTVIGEGTSEIQKLVIARELLRG
ncbi:MAG: acyl-CoA dehydrogenase [Candidatus Eisenbacteria bacterium]